MSERLSVRAACVDKVLFQETVADSLKINLTQMVDQLVIEEYELRDNTTEEEEYIDEMTEASVGGVEVKKNGFPWHVGLMSIKGTIPFCGGSIIKENKILTAAHCIYEKNRGRWRQPEDIKVVAGEHDLGTNDDGQEIHDVCRIDRHPYYNRDQFTGKRKKLNFDVAVLTLCCPLTYRDEIKKIALATIDSDNNFTNKVSTFIVH